MFGISLARISIPRVPKSVDLLTDPFYLPLSVTLDARNQNLEARAELKPSPFKKLSASDCDVSSVFGRE